MAITRYSGFDKTVNTIADRNAIPNKVNGMTVVVRDAIADIAAGAGKAVYRWDDFDSIWILISKETTETLNFITEEATIINGIINLSYIPVNNQVWNGVILNNNLIYAILNIKNVIISLGKISGIPAEFNGMVLRITYAYGTIAAQVTTVIEESVDAAMLNNVKTINGQEIIGTGNIDITTTLPEFKTINSQTIVGTGDITTSFSDILNTPTTVSGYGITDAYTKTEVYNKTEIDAKQIDLSNYTGNIIPSANSVYDIGSTTNRFRSIYVDEAYLSTNTLYIGNTPVLGTNQDTIVVKADPDQSLLVKTSGLGTTNIESQTGVMLTTSGTNANVEIQATGINSKVRFSGTGGIELSSNVSAQYDVAVSGNLTVSGNLVANGSQFTVNATTVTTKDNQIVINDSEVGAGVTAGKAGIKVDRGTEPDYEFVFIEADDSFKIGREGELQKVATREDTPIDTGLATWDASTSRFVTSRDVDVDSVSLGNGVLTWNPDEGTLDIDTGTGVIIQAGQENNRVVRNGTGSTIVNGTVVMVTGTVSNSGRLVVAPASGATGIAMRVYGVATQDIPAGQDGYVTIDGKVRGLNTTGSAVGEVWVDGDVLYVKPNDDGNLTKVVPTYGQLKMPVANVIHAHKNGTLEVRVTPIDENAYEPSNSNIQGHIIDTSNPHGVTKAQVGLGNVDDTSDADKPISTATQTALDNKVDEYNISTTEYNTGVKRGTKEVFGIEIDLGLLPNSGTKDVEFTFNPLFTYWIDTSNSYASSSSEVITLPYLGFIGDEVSVKLDRVNNKIVTMAANDRTTLTGKLVILYTK